jgi:hypothetical protein
MQTSLVDPRIINLYTVAHLHVDIVLIYSVMNISPFINYKVVHVCMTFCVLCAPLKWLHILVNMLEEFLYTY